MIRILSYLPVERHFPLCRSVLRFAVRSPRVLRSSGGFHPALVVREKQRTLQHILTPHKTPWSQEDSGSCLAVATPEVRGHSLRCGCSFGFSSAHLLGWMRRSCRYSLAFSQSWLAGALRRVCERGAASFAVVDGEAFQSSPTDWTSSVSVSASCLSPGGFCAEVCGWGLSHAQLQALNGSCPVT